jgi:hypothetical protein
LLVTLRDSCGFPVVGNDDAYVWVQGSPEGNFRLCCAAEQATVQWSDVMLPTAPTDADGRAQVEIWWGGGGDTDLAMQAFLDPETPLPDVIHVGSRSPDLAGDCDVGLADMGEFTARYYGTTAWQADFNCSGRVDLADFAIFSAHYCHNCSSGRTEPIPQELVWALGGERLAAPVEFVLGPSVPNPFNPETEICYSVPPPGYRVSIAVFDLSGRRVRKLVDGEQGPGEHRVTWDGRNDQGKQVASGTYFYRMEAPGFGERKKILLVK